MDKDNLILYWSILCIFYEAKWIYPELKLMVQISTLLFSQCETKSLKSNVNCKVIKEVKAIKKYSEKRFWEHVETCGWNWLGTETNAIFRSVNRFLLLIHTSKLLRSSLHYNILHSFCLILVLWRLLSFFLSCSRIVETVDSFVTSHNTVRYAHPLIQIDMYNIACHSLQDKPSLFCQPSQKLGASSPSQMTNCAQQ